jgi:hypothetical protein
LHVYLSNRSADTTLNPSGDTTRTSIGYKTMVYTTQFRALAVKNNRNDKDSSLPGSNEPGTQSILIPKEGTAPTMQTSSDVTNTQIFQFTGKATPVISF